MPEKQLKKQPEEQVHAEILKVLSEGVELEAAQACCKTVASASIR